MDELDRKINSAFPGYAVRKDLVKMVRGNAAVPSYVLEFLLGQNCATDDEAQIAAGVERVKDILAKHYVQRAEAGAVRSDIKQEGYRRVIDKVSVELNTRRDAYEATFENLGITHVLVGADVVKENRRLLVSGVWCIADLTYSANEAKDESPFLLTMLKPIQMAGFDMDEHVRARAAFSAGEWVDVVIRTIGLDPSQLSGREKLYQLTRLVTYCERNYNYVELGPKGTGKSHVFSEFSPHGILISGGEVTPAKLFVNNSTGKIGLVGYWDAVAFDEFAGKNKRPKPDIVDIMKNYMANKSFSRGIEQVTAEASMAFVGNTSHDVGYMVRNSDLFEDLPAMYHDPAFIDRIHAYVPGWEMVIIRGDMFCQGFGLIVDYLAEALRHLRAYDYSNLYAQWFELSDSISTRDRDGVTKTFSGLAKIVFPDKEMSKEECRWLLEAAIEMRERVKDQLYRIDGTFERVEFSYADRQTGEVREVKTLEEAEYAGAYHARDLVAGPVASAAVPPAGEDLFDAREPEVEAFATAPAAAAEGDDEARDDGPALFEGHREFRENQRGASYDTLFGDYLEGAREVRVVDPYVRNFYQCRNLMELLEVVLRRRDFSLPEVRVSLTTAPDEYPGSHQEDYLAQIRDAVAPMGVDFSWEIDRTGTLHARHLYVDDRWDILLDRGLDIYQRFDANDAFCLEASMPEMRRVKQFEVTYLKVGE
ncbi:BREX system Lon protease-like protein BrxL [Paratractidigestivibacter sp.]|uniref:BREX system Lon protease-like protein BrxL n=1 Tax=Paratractidigestivibacter sp. TaxID=2847316 RepID=UPI002AC8AE42|nr:BREX system Lon protease-like protein BrxL [Paratractidigestivibacter sp.]